MDIKFTEEFPLDRFVNTANLDEVLYKFENERKLSDLPNYKKSYTLEEFLAEFPNSTEDKSITSLEIKDDASGNPLEVKADK